MACWGLLVPLSDWAGMLQGALFARRVAQHSLSLGLIGTQPGGGLQFWLLAFVGWGRGLVVGPRPPENPPQWRTLGG